MFHPCSSVAHSYVLDELGPVGYREIRGLEPAYHGYHLGVTMTKAELKSYQQTLLELRTRLNGDVSHLADEALHQTGSEAGGNLSSMPIHMADLGTDAYEQENTLNLLQNEEQVLADIAVRPAVLRCRSTSNETEQGLMTMVTRNEAFPSKYLKHEDLGGEPMTVTIKSAALETMKGSRRQG